MELEKLRQAEKLELEKMHQETERRKLDLEQSRLELIREGKLVPGGSGGHDDASMGSAPGGLDIVANLRLVPQFNERDPDSFFTLFEHVADAKKKRKKKARFRQGADASVCPHWSGPGGLFGYMW